MATLHNFCTIWTQKIKTMDHLDGHKYNHHDVQNEPLNIIGA